MSTDFIPRSDTDFLAWAQNFSSYANTNIAALGLAPGDMTPIGTAMMDYDTALTANTARQNDARAARVAKDAKRDTLETAIRALVRRLQASPSVDDSEKAALGITVKDALRTMDAMSGATQPLAMIDTSQRLRHEIRFVDEANPTSRAKPKGAMGCEIWVKVAAQGEPAPAEATAYSFVALDTASPMWSNTMAQTRVRLRITCCDGL
ncbi:MAG TPA: hypothetical protein DD726_02205 [Phycisphaerales bacterium]|nr:hypothetical protein [Phycisphaerales bacterium]